MIVPSAEYAIDILSRLLKASRPELLAYWIAPNTVLTLSGARAVCDGVFYQDDKKLLQLWVQEMDHSIEILKGVIDIYLAEARIDTNPMKDRCATYDLVTTQGLAYVLSQTQLLKIKMPDLSGRKMDASQLSEALIASLQDNPRLKELGREQLEHIASGILLGYPDKAIMGTLGYFEKVELFAEPYIPADIRGARYYSCPIPVYDYPRSLINDSDITSHERQWSKILKDFYQSDFHSGLVSDRNFVKRAKQLGLYELRDDEP